MSVIAYECLSTLVNTFSAYLRLCIVSLCCFSFNGYVGNPQPTAPSRVPFLLSTLSPLPQRFSSGHSLQKYLSFPLRWYFLFFIFFATLSCFTEDLPHNSPFLKLWWDRGLFFFSLGDISHLGVVPQRPHSDHTVCDAKLVVEFSLNKFCKAGEQTANIPFLHS